MLWKERKANPKPNVLSKKAIFVKISLKKTNADNDDRNDDHVADDRC